MITTAIKYKQNNTTFLSTVLNSKDIYNNSEVWVYGQHEYGYQREIKRDHVKGIEKYISESKTYLFPSSVILAVNEVDYLLCNQEAVSDDIFRIDFKNIRFRIVDGQHRLEALKHLDISIFLNVIILVVKEDERKVELDIFTNLNSKAKRIPTDLAELAKYRYQLLSEGANLNRDDSADYVAMKTIIELNEKSKIWVNAIKVNIQTENNVGIVSVTGFKKSIVPLLKQMIEKKVINKIEDLDSLSEDFYKLIDDAWNICYNKWHGCFNELEQINQQHVYEEGYYIQKTMGVSVINGLLHEIYESTKTHEEALVDFTHIITTSHVKISDWKVAGPMYGHSSEAGFKKIRRFVRGDILQL